MMAQLWLALLPPLLLLALLLVLVMWVRRLPATPLPLLEQIDAVLPQTQCGQCGYSGCRPYATALVAGEADINQCPPGGQEGVVQIARLMQVPVKPLDSSRGETKPFRLAVIDEANCIGCTLCIQACPVDAIVGAAKQMHTVLAGACTGCELCIPPCPTACIDMVAPVELQAEAAVPPPTVELEHPEASQPCIRCGACIEVCSAELQPQALYWFTSRQQEALAEQHGLLSCTECGDCNRACPSQLPLVQQFRDTRARLQQHHEARQRADAAREQHAWHVVRLARDKQERADRLAAKAPVVQEAEVEQVSDEVKARQAAIDAAMARARQQLAARDNGEST